MNDDYMDDKDRKLYIENKHLLCFVESLEFIYPSISAYYNMPQHLIDISKRIEVNEMLKCMFECLQLCKQYQEKYEENWLDNSYVKEKILESQSSTMEMYNFYLEKIRLQISEKIRDELGSVITEKRYMTTKIESLEAENLTLKNEIEDLQPKKCVSCLSEICDNVFIPCGHVCICSTCLSDFKLSNYKECPICRNRYENIIKIFKS